MTEAQASNYWISSSLVTATLNVDGNYNQVLISVDDKARLYVYIEDYIKTIPVVNAYSNKIEQQFQNFSLSSLSYVIPDNALRYLYAVVPRKTYTESSYEEMPATPTGYLTLLTEKIDLAPTTDTINYYIFLGAVIGASETNGTLHERAWQQTIDFGSLSPVKDAAVSQYWIKQGAIAISLNALSVPDKINASVLANSVIMAYVPGYDGLDYDAGHNYRKWSLAAYPTAFSSTSKKYVYVAIPRSSAMNNQTAYVVYPPEHIGIDGKNLAGEQIGSDNYYYIYLRAIISSSGDNGTTSRTWLNADGEVSDTCTIEWGMLSTDDQSTNGSESEWWSYNRVSGLVTFLKTIATATFNKLFAKKAEVTDLTVTNEVATTQQIVDHTDWGTYTADASGATVRRNSDGNWLIETDYLKVRKKATFTNVEIQDVYHVGGQMMLTSASCRVDMVDEVKENNAVVGYRIYFKKYDTTGDLVDNTWLVGDQAYCNTFNLIDGSNATSNHFLWRLVTYKDTYPTIDTWSNSTSGSILPYVTEAQNVASETLTLQAFIESWQSLLAETKYIIDDATTYLESSALTAINAAMNVVATHVNAVLDGSETLAVAFSSDLINNGIKKYASCLDSLRLQYLKAAYHTLVLSNVRNTDTCGYAEGSDAPAVDDNLVQLGYRGTATDSTTKNRQGALVLAGAGDSSPYIYMFKNVGRKWGETKAIKELGEETWNNMVSSGTSAAYLAGSYFILPSPYIQISPDKTIINADEIHYGTTTDDEGFDDTTNDLTSIFNTYDSQIASLRSSIGEIGDQTDGSFRIWQGEDANEPTGPLTDDGGNRLEGWLDANLTERIDDFYIATDGRVWQFKYTALKGYYWDPVTDEYLISFVNQIKEKRRVFLLLDDGANIVSADAVATYFSTRDYEVGDLWVNAYYYVSTQVDGSTSAVITKVYDNDTLVCIKDKDATKGFQITDWNKDNGYGERINEAMKIIENISSDNVILAGDEKSSLAREFNKIVSTHNSFYGTDGTTHKYSSISYTEYETAYTNLCTLMYAVFGITSWGTSVEDSTKSDAVYGGNIKLATTVPDGSAVSGFTNLYLSTDGYYYIKQVDDDSTFNFYWQQYYDEEATLQDAISSYVVTVGSESYTILENMAEDYIITRQECTRLKEISTEIDAEHTNLDAYGRSYGSNATVLANFSDSIYNAFASAFNAYQQAYLDYHALVDIILNKYTKPVLLHVTGIDGDEDELFYGYGEGKPFERLDILIDGEYVLGSTDLVGANTYRTDTYATKYALNTLDSSNNKNLSTVYAGYTSGDSYWVMRDEYLDVIAKYKDAALDLQNEITSIAQELSEENARAAAQSLVSASVADNILTSNEKHAICQELNSIGSEMQYAITKAKEILGTSISEPTYPVDGSTSAVSLYNAQLAVYNAYTKMSIFFNLLAGDTTAYITEGGSVVGAKVANGVAHTVGITRDCTYDGSAPTSSITLGYTFTVDVNSSNIVDSYDLTNFYYRYMADPSTADGKSSYGEPQGSASSATGYTDADSYQYRWYIGRDGGTEGQHSFLDAFSDYYNARDNFDNAITTYNKAIGDKNGSDIEKNGSDIKELKASISDISDDNLIKQDEKTEVLVKIWNNIKAQYNAVSFHSTKTTTESTLYSKYEALKTVVTPIVSDGNLSLTFYLSGYTGTTTDMLPVRTDGAISGTSDVTRAAFNTLFSDFDSAYAAYTSDIDNQLKAVSEDGIIDISEKNTIANKWETIKGQYSKYSTHFASTPTTIEQSVTDAYNAVKVIMGQLGYDISNSDTKKYVTNADKAYYLSDYDGNGSLSKEDMVQLTDSPAGGVVSRTEFDAYFTTFDSALAAYQSACNANIATANANANTALKTVQGAVDDGIVTPSEIAETIAPKWAVIYKEYNTTYDLDSKTYDTCSSEQKAIIDAYTALAKYIDALGISVNGSGQVTYSSSTYYYLSDYTDTNTEGLTELLVDGNNPSRQDFIKAFSDYDNAMSAYQEDKNTDIEAATTAVAGIASDGIISAGSEKQNLYQIYYQILTTAGNYEKQCQTYGITYSYDAATQTGSCSYADGCYDTSKTPQVLKDNPKTLGTALITYAAAFKTLQTYLITTLAVFGDFTTDTNLSPSSSASAFREAFTTYYTAEETFAKAFEDFKKKQLASASIDMVGGTISITADDLVSIDSSKVKIGDSNLGAWFTFSDGTMTGNNLVFTNGTFTGTVNASGGTITGEMKLTSGTTSISLDPTGSYPKMKIADTGSSSYAEFTAFVDSDTGYIYPRLYFHRDDDTYGYYSQDMLHLENNFTRSGKTTKLQATMDGAHLTLLGPAGQLEINLYGDKPYVRIYDNTTSSWVYLYGGE